MGISKRHLNTKWRRISSSEGYLLLPVIAIGLAISIVSAVLFQSIAQNSQNLNSQSYRMIANEAAKAGVVTAQKCLKTYNPSNQWPLISTNCTLANSTSDDCASIDTSAVTRVVNGTDSDGAYESTFCVKEPVMTTIGVNDGIMITSVGRVTITSSNGVKTFVTDTVRAFAQTVGVQASRNIKQVSTGALTTCVIATDYDGTNGWPYCWGDNVNGQLGIGYYLGGGDNSNTYSTVPMAVEDGHVDARSEVIQKHFVCNGWQTNVLGCLSIGSYVDIDWYVPPSPAANSELVNKVATKVSVGTDHTCSIARNSEANAQSAQVYCWGKNDYGQLGSGNNDTSLVPIATSSNWTEHIPRDCSGWIDWNGFCWGTDYPAHDVIHDSALKNKTVVDISAGNYFTCAKYVDQSSVSSGMSADVAMALPGMVACWGKNDNGQLGNNSRTNTVIPVDVDTSVSNFSAINGKQIKTLASVKGGATMCVTDTTDKAYCWGQNYAGQVGNGQHGINTTTIWTPPCGWGAASYINISTGHDALTPKAVLTTAKFRNISVFDNWTTGITTPASPSNPNRAYYWGGTTSAGCGPLNTNWRYYHANSPGLANSTPEGTGTTVPFDAGQQLSSMTSGNPYNGPFCSTINVQDLYCIRQSSLTGVLNSTSGLSGRSIVDMDTSMVGRYSCMISKTGSADGIVHCWGSNEKGQLGNRTVFFSSIPTPTDTYLPATPVVTASSIGVTGGYVINDPIYF
ncbi:MAG: hypothetical protein WAW80_05240 [Candidatus Saccharimonadales bacterium]